MSDIMKNWIIVVLIISTFIIIGCTPIDSSYSDSSAQAEVIFEDQEVEATDTSVAKVPEGEDVSEDESGNTNSNSGPSVEVTEDDIEEYVIEEITEAKPLTLTGNVLAGGASKYLDFNQADYDAALASDKTVFLFFYASWCPKCVRAELDVFDAFNTLDDENVVGFKVHYRDSQVTDQEEDLAREWGVSTQDTKVIIKNGKRVVKSPEVWSKQRYIDEIKAVSS